MPIDTGGAGAVVDQGAALRRGNQLPQFIGLKHEAPPTVAAKCSRGSMPCGASTRARRTLRQARPIMLWSTPPGPTSMNVASGSAATRRSTERCHSTGSLTCRVRCETKSAAVGAGLASPVTFGT